MGYNNMKKEVEEFLKESNAIEEVFDDDSLKQARYAWEYLMKQNGLTPGIILKTHKILMLHQNLYPFEKGYFRNVTVYIGGQPTINALRVPNEIEHWCDEGVELLIDPKKLHIRYEKIHPFVDGNGRTGRMFMNWQRIKRLKLPLLIIHTGKEQQEYYKWFK